MKLPRPGTIGFRLALFHVLAVGGTVAGLFLLGRFLVVRQARAGLDGLLEVRLADVADRLLADPEAGARDFSEAAFAVTVRDRWTEPAFRQARLRGEPPPEPAIRRFYDQAAPGVGAPLRGVRGRLGEPSRPVGERVLEGTAGAFRIRIATSLAPVAAAVRLYTRIGLSLAGLALAASVAAGYALSRTALRPVRAMQRAAARISSDNLSERIPVASVDDEISRLARLLNRTFERLESSFEQVRRFSEDASHEMKTPLSLIRLNVERLLGQEALAPAAREALHDTVEEIHRLDRLIERLLFLSRAQVGEVVLAADEQDPREFIASFSHDAGILAEARGAAYVEAANESGRVCFDPGHVRQVLFNLLANALRAVSARGHVWLRSQFHDGWWRITMEDDGVGLPREQCEAIFGRFVRLPRGPSAAAPSGAGLGLAICRSIADLHHGRIYAEPRAEGAGLRLILELPAAAERKI